MTFFGLENPPPSNISPKFWTKKYRLEYKTPAIKYFESEMTPLRTFPKKHLFWECPTSLKLDDDDAVGKLTSDHPCPARERAPPCSSWWMEQCTVVVKPDSLTHRLNMRSSQSGKMSWISRTHLCIKLVKS